MRPALLARSVVVLISLSAVMCIPTDFQSVYRKLHKRGFKDDTAVSNLLRAVQQVCSDRVLRWNILHALTLRAVHSLYELTCMHSVFDTVSATPTGAGDGESGSLRNGSRTCVRSSSLSSSQTDFLF